MESGGKPPFLTSTRHRCVFAFERAGASRPSSPLLRNELDMVSRASRASLPLNVLRNALHTDSADRMKLKATGIASGSGLHRSVGPSVVPTAMSNGNIVAASNAHADRTVPAIG